MVLKVCLLIFVGQLGLMLNFLRSKSPLDSGLQAVYVRLDEAHRKSKNISDSSLSFLKETDKHYFEMMNRVIRHPWSFARSYRRIDPSLKWKNSYNRSTGEYANAVYCLYSCMFVCTMYVCVYDICLYVCMFVYICMSVCLYVYICVCI